MENFTNSPDELQHWGIKGMKWGIRRYQNKDGSLTPAGRKRYDDDPDNDSNDTSNSPKKAPHEMTGKDYKKMKLDDMTDDELMRAINRSRAEQTFKQLNPEPVSKGKVIAEKFVNEALIPVAVNAGKNFMDKQLGKIIDKALADNTPKTEKQKLQEAFDVLDLKKKIAETKQKIGEIGKEKEKSNAEKIKEHKEALEAELWEDPTYREAYRMGMFGKEMKTANEGKMTDAVTDFNSKYFGKKNNDDNSTNTSSNSSSKSDNKTETKTESKSEPKTEKVSGEVTGEGTSTSKIKQEMDSSSKSEYKPSMKNWSTPDNIMNQTIETAASSKYTQIRQRDEAARTSKYLDELEKRYKGAVLPDTSENRSKLSTPEERELQQMRDEGEAFIKRLQNVGQVFTD